MGGNLYLKFADGNEKFVALGGTEEENPKQGEVVYADDKEVLCRRWNWRESDNTKLTEETKVVTEKKEIKIPAVITVRDFAKVLDKPVNEVIKELMKNGVMASLNERIDFETAAIIADEFDVKVVLSEEIEVKESRGKKIKNEHDPEAVNIAVRVGAELGADIVKTNYTGDIDSFKYIVKSVQVPVIIAGGPKMDTTTDILQLVYDSIQAGGAGVAFGRNVFQSDDPTKLVKAITKIVHKNYTVDEVLKEFKFD